MSEIFEKILSFIMSIITVVSGFVSGINKTSVTIDANKLGDEVPAIVNT